MPVLVTGVAGFIGFHVARALMRQGETVIGIDNLNSYYDVGLKRARLAVLEREARFSFFKVDLADRVAMAEFTRSCYSVDRIVHLAAQAGVRYSLLDPYAYVASNIMGHLAILEMARALPDLRHLVYASSSSVYGGDLEAPFRESERIERPLSLYAATKRADELMSAAYDHLFGIPQTGLRFFTAYGPWGRPDMAYYAFAKAITQGEEIQLFDHGRLKRDFTYIDDIVDGVIRCLDRPPSSADGARLINIGNNRPEEVSYLVQCLEKAIGKKAMIRTLPCPLTDVQETAADITLIHELTGFKPRTELDEGIRRFVAWFRDYHRV
ncbi:NAD-dependent epimerase/dehydratase family protein [Granulibacter bethesdensis]|uniref:UDP-N-acetylglucosamine 4-epimerase n=2 Tax=Granulibacter bethesdensis TaxID=364410 RepID=Q0BU68_GRABC|nr:NAD-dependent epimerase/dehydratase family protein [Granulibacter bethesdensis]ABI61634.1 UDP-N-acetylglucosamine 4-epimerase [Granulibacter bethesdensis CGDNIH1]AHJ62532.1 UDP-N-acetylglucosamine 4-epimerase [Granulibacter bethesdensis]AHJ67780.1 UDP-N-acetylglucosamine 4-epimerase [Granulibacter bethesdensis]APH51439.1 UDP-N-acetylglucosamine 4-epimerase [Granulibacter bethesdensis]APH64132.1 UDP-N-acetylglucosamine 4-epimerase [Granulibacter bethesdensis]